MKLSYVIGDPAGNITLMVTSSVPVEKREAAAAALMRLASPTVEQVGFFTEPTLGAAARLEMCGGEFCGNALRCAGMYTAIQNKAPDGEIFKIEISGCPVPMDVRVYPTKQTAEASIPGPKEILEETISGKKLGVVVFDGIVHGILEGEYADEELAKKLTRILAEKYQKNAAGLLSFCWKDGAYRMEPWVFVPAVDTLFHENSCASGTAALACYLGEEEMAGIFEYRVVQPGGELKAVTILEECDCLALSVSGPVVLFEEQTAQIEIE